MFSTSDGTYGKLIANTIEKQTTTDKKRKVNNNKQTWTKGQTNLTRAKGKRTNTDKQ